MFTVMVKRDYMGLYRNHGKENENYYVAFCYGRARSHARYGAVPLSGFCSARALSAYFTGLLLRNLN